jgi:hypothetical protein
MIQLVSSENYDRTDRGVLALAQFGCARVTVTKGFRT